MNRATQRHLSMQTRSQVGLVEDPSDSLNRVTADGPAEGRGVLRLELGLTLTDGSVQTTDLLDANLIHQLPEEGRILLARELLGAVIEVIRTRVNRLDDGVTFEYFGDGWVVRQGPRVFPLPDLVGIKLLVEVLIRPYADLHVLYDLEPVIDPRAVVDRPQDIDWIEAGLDLDDPAWQVGDMLLLKNCRGRKRELENELAAAIDLEDLKSAAACRSLLDELTTSMRAYQGPAGKLKVINPEVERARSRVVKRITDAIIAISAKDAVLGLHLERSVVTKTICRYEPESGTALVFRRADGPAR